MTKYGYARVSTASQSTKEQIQQLLENGVEKKNIFSEKFTGTKRDRAKFNQLLAGLKSGDEIVVTKLDRFARNTREALDIIEPLLDDNVTIKVLNLGTIENTSMGRMVTRTLLSVAEMERDMIVERTQEGKMFAKKNNPNFKEGRPKATITPKKRHAYELLISGKSYKEVESITGYSRSTLFRIKKKIEESEATMEGTATVKYSR
ncbi:recombinase family protein [Enterococcus gallinarum]|nr:recombinase family protein [Enterococcus gallinarum]MDL4875672.1 recombinase family protein [Enterococcus gallinarum]MDL4921254.1 recombinase family protein [Enterococcus gallinarum]MDL4982960.1 recombinase family protein [Enterococcus gallinarum]MDL4986692.1 recombinase family protein [Enterococcus gallinarum]PNY30315.1 DNA invertase Pin [Enterococcus gallinarum]